MQVHRARPCRRTGSQRQAASEAPAATTQISSGLMAGKRGLGLIHSRLQQAADRMLASRMRIGDALVIATNSAGQQADEMAHVSVCPNER